MANILCKPMLMDCLSCSEERNQANVINGSHFCFCKKKCTVPYAVIDGETGRIITWVDNVDMTK